MDQLYFIQMLKLMMFNLILFHQFLLLILRKVMLFIILILLNLLIKVIIILINFLHLNQFLILYYYLILILVLFNQIILIMYQFIIQIMWVIIINQKLYLLQEQYQVQYLNHLTFMYFIMKVVFNFYNILILIQLLIFELYFNQYLQNKLNHQHFYLMMCYPDKILVLHQFISNYCFMLKETYFVFYI